jgi:hypothetical protein
MDLRARRRDRGEREGLAWSLALLLWAHRNVRTLIDGRDHSAFLLPHLEGASAATPTEYSAWLEEAGFRHIETVWFDAPAANGAVIGRKP